MGVEIVNDLRHVAIHEAGHAVIGRVLALPCGEATIEPDFEDGSAGYSHSGEFWDVDEEWMRRGKCRIGEHLPIARVITLMAGAEAEIELLGTCEGGDGDDRIEIWRTRQFHISATDERLRKMTKMLVRRHRALIERVAKALLTEITISGPYLDKLIGRSINDVKPNMTEEQIAFWRS